MAASQDPCDLQPPYTRFVTGHRFEWRKALEVAKHPGSHLEVQITGNVYRLVRARLPGEVDETA